VQIQHSEFLFKREKLVFYQQVSRKAAQKRHQSLDKLRSSLIQWRAKIASQQASPQSPKDSQALLKKLQSNHNGRLLDQMPRLIALKTDLLQQESRKLEVSIASKENLVMKYCSHFGIDRSSLVTSVRGTGCEKDATTENTMEVA
jgi:hypothetical protein